MDDDEVIDLAREEGFELVDAHRCWGVRPRG
jgi:hypothetical protein